MSKKRYDEIIDEVYNNYILNCRLWLENFLKENPEALVDYQEDTKEMFIKKIIQDKDCYTGAKDTAAALGLKIEERELSIEERLRLKGCDEEFINEVISGGNWVKIDPKLECKYFLDYQKIPTKLITVTYKNETIEVYE